MGIAPPQDIRSSRIYLVEAAADHSDASKIAAELLSDPVTDQFSMLGSGAACPTPNDSAAIEIHYRAGVMDPAAASTAKALRDMGIDVASVRTAQRFVFHPAPAGRDLRTIAALLANDSVAQAVIGSPPVGPPPDPPRASNDLRHLPLRAMDERALAALARQGHLFLSIPEMSAIQAEFVRLGRDPTDLELETLAQTWSEHCVHKTLKSEIIYRGSPMPGTNLARAEIRYANLLRDTIARATDDLMRRNIGPTCLSVFKDNAGVIAFDDRFGIAFKVETHNHPSAIEPYGGASTGLGGCIRDVIGCGLGAQPIACTDVFCVAPPDWPADALPRGALHPRRTLQGVVAGVRDYGNRMGIPTLNGAIHYDPRFLGNPLVFCGCVGLIPRDRIRKAARPGDAVVLVGGRTGRDGIHGATFSSAELTGAHASEFSHAVQIGNAIEEKKLLDVILLARDHRTADGVQRCLYSAITDCGAGGLSSAVGEMAAHCGAVVDLDRVPLKYEGLRYDEIWISEAQERMVLALPPENLDRFLKICRDEDVEAVDIGCFTDSGRLVVRFDGNVVGDLGMSFLHDGMPRQTRVAEWNPPSPPPAFKQNHSSGADVRTELLRRLADPTVASKEWLIRQYDHEVQGRSAVKPLVGPRGQGPGDAAVIRPCLDSPRGIAIGCGLCPQLSDLDPYWMAWAAIDEAIRNVVCVGGDPTRTAILDNFCWGRPDNPNQLGGLVRACQACHDAAIAYGAPFISGKDSLNNEFVLEPADADRVRAELSRHGCDIPIDSPRISIPGTLLISAVALLDDVSRCVTMDPRGRASKLLLVGRPTRFLDAGPASWPPWDPSVAAATHRFVAQAIQNRLATAVHDVSDGGLLVACAEMAVAADVSIDLTAGAEFYWHTRPAMYLVEVPSDKIESFAKLAANRPWQHLGTINPPGDSSPRLRIPSAAAANAPPVSIEVSDLRRAWLT